MNTEVKPTEALEESRRKAVEAQKQMQDAQEQMGNSIKEVIATGLQEIFDRYPFLGSVTWTQYTPWFNDGDACIFNSHIDYPGVNSTKDVEEGSYGYCEEPGEDFGSRSEKELYKGYDSETRRSKYEPNPNYDPEWEQCYTEVHSFMSSLRGPRTGSGWDQEEPFDSAMKAAFGDHIQVTVTRDGFEIDGYEHD